MIKGPKAPKDPVAKGKGFFVMKDQDIEAVLRADKTRVQEICLDDGRIESAAALVGGIEDQEILSLLKTAAGFRRLVTGIGVSVSAEGAEAAEAVVEFQMIAYGRKDGYHSGTHADMAVTLNGIEQFLDLSEITWSEDDEVIGQFVFVFPEGIAKAKASVKLYLKEGFDVPEDFEDAPANFCSAVYSNIIAQSLIQTGNTERFLRAVKKAQNGEDVTIAFIGGSITQGAGAAPSVTQCYAYRAYRAFADRYQNGGNIHYIRAGIGGTPSELGVIRYEKDVLEYGKNKPDIVVIEFAVNDDGDETEGDCYEGLLRKVWFSEEHPAVVLLFSVFAFDWNLQERFIPMGKRYDLPMVSVKNAVTEQFFLTEKTGRVFTKRQFFYDTYHPNNLGHTVMADCLSHFFDEAVKKAKDSRGCGKQQKTETATEQISPVKSADFERTEYFDRAVCAAGVEIEPGSFTAKDTDLQMVERNLDDYPSGMFPDNWMHDGTAGENKPFILKLRCRILLLIAKDSAEELFGKAVIRVDGRVLRIYDPHEVGWTHCNATLLLREKESREHVIEISMEKGQEHKRFTILGFGYVKD